MATADKPREQPASVPPLILRGKLTSTSLAGEVVIVTGAGGGIGLEAARSLLQLGASVAIAEIDGSLERPALSELAHTGALAGAMFVRADVSDETSVQALVGQVESRFGKVDVVLNNATYSRPAWRWWRPPSRRGTEATPSTCAVRLYWPADVYRP